MRDELTNDGGGGEFRFVGGTAIACAQNSSFLKIGFDENDKGNVFKFCGVFQRILWLVWNPTPQT